MAVKAEHPHWHRRRAPAMSPAGPRRASFTAFGLAALALAAACRRTPPEAAGATERQESASPRFFAAVALGLFGHPSDPAQADADMAAIQALGATGVVLPVFWRSADVTSTKIEPFAYGVPQSAYDRSTIEIARRAHARGLAFEVLPIVQLEKLAVDEWRGTLRPSDWEPWWRSYRTFILHHAGIAEAANAEFYSVGSELGSTESDRASWSALIADVRRVYRGRVLYSANWDHYEAVTFWDLLDGIGLSSYYELASTADAPQAVLDEAWRVQRDRILAWARPFGKPVFLTEVGYPARSGAAVHPWDYTQNEPVDAEAQARCFRAFAAAWQDAPELGGATIWIWDHGKSGPADPSYSISGKPAAGVVRRFFARRTSHRHTQG